jgi:hypothetical protein
LSYAQVRRKRWEVRRKKAAERKVRTTKIKKPGHEATRDKSQNSSAERR